MQKLNLKKIIFMHIVEIVLCTDDKYDDGIEFVEM